MPCLTGPNAVRKGKLFFIKQEPGWNKNYETVERKGLGHPDTISNTLAAKISQAYSKYTLKHCEGLILHHQVDKLMIIGGKTAVTFVEGKFVEPIQIIIAGRASYSFGDKKIPVDEIIHATIISHFRRHFPLVKEQDIIIKNYLTDYAGPGTIHQSKGAIAKMFNPEKRKEVRGYENLVANDTSYCISYAPLSPLEKSVIHVEKYLNSKETKKKYPWLGTDIKIMAVRNNRDVAITSCIPQIAKHVSSLQQYKENLHFVGDLMYKKFAKHLSEYNVELLLNTKDDYEKMNVYLAVSGASLSGDIGVVGRGNRTNGLITSNRPMSMEATNGKNPRYYSGFIYANVAKRISNRIYKELQAANIVEIVSQNGGLLKDPWRTRVVSTADQKRVEQIIREEYENIENVSKEFLSGNIENF